MTHDSGHIVPEEVTGIGIMMLLSGTLNLLAGTLLFLSFVWFCVGIVFLIPMTTGLFEVLVGAALLSGVPVPNARLVCYLGALAALINFGNPFSLSLEIVASVLIGRPKVALWIAG